MLVYSGGAARRGCPPNFPLLIYAVGRGRAHAGRGCPPNFPLLIWKMENLVFLLEKTVFFPVRAQGFSVWGAVWAALFRKAAIA